MKTCFKCNTEKPLSEFYKHSQMADGHLGKCKECAKKDSIKRRWDKIEEIREYDRRRGKSKKRTEANAKRTRIFRKLFPEKYKAYIVVNNAIRSGKLIKPEKCSICGILSSIEGHHNDYSRPLEIIWMCSCCHSQFHRDIKPF